MRKSPRPFGIFFHSARFSWLPTQLTYLTGLHVCTAWNSEILPVGLVLIALARYLNFLAPSFDPSRLGFCATASFAAS